MNDPRLDADRLEELLADEALFALTKDERDELDRLMASSTVDPETFERTAALAAIALYTGSIEPLPDDLRRRILDSSNKHVSGEIAAKSRRETPVFSPDGDARPRLFVDENGRHRAMRPREMLAWTFAVTLLVILSIGWSFRRPDSRMATSVAELRDKMLRHERDVVVAPWVAGEDPSGRGVVGDVVWSNRRQRGYLRFRGLVKNVTDHSQYQLWIFDSKQDERYPISGGVFDIQSADGDTIIPIDAELRVLDPKMFAVTMERTGGVVVSSRSRLLLVAKPDAPRA